MSPLDTSGSNCDRCKASAPQERPPRWSLFERLMIMFGRTDLHIMKRRRRLALRRLTDDQLKDIGLSRRQIAGGCIDAENDRLDSIRYRR